jgi:hypothetical protein
MTCRRRRPLGQPIRVGRAYISFYAFAHGDDRATLTIEVPDGFEVSTRGGDIATSIDAKGRTILTTAGSVDDNHWYVIVEGTRPAALQDGDAAGPDRRPAALPRCSLVARG